MAGAARTNAIGSPPSRLLLDVGADAVAGEVPRATLGDAGCYRSCPGSVGIAIDPILLLRDPVAALKNALHIRR